jgi:hypothetical protein
MAHKRKPLAATRKTGPHQAVSDLVPLGGLQAGGAR